MIRVSDEAHAAAKELAAVEKEAMEDFVSRLLLERLMAKRAAQAKELAGDQSEPLSAWHPWNE